MTSPKPPRTSSLRTPGGEARRVSSSARPRVQGRGEVGAQGVAEVQARHAPWRSRGRARPRCSQGLGEQVGRGRAPRRRGRAAPAAKASCSSWARPTHGMPSKSSLSLLRGVSRFSSWPGPVQHHGPQPADLAVGAVVVRSWLASRSASGRRPRISDARPAVTHGAARRQTARADVVQHVRAHVAQQHPAGDDGEPARRRAARPGRR